MRTRVEGTTVPRFLFKANYTLDGLQGLMKEGGTGRKKAVETLATSLGGHLVSIDYAFGDTDTYVICELPDDQAAAAASLRITATGMATVSTVRLLDPTQIDEAVDRQLEYRAPGT